MLLASVLRLLLMLRCCVPSSAYHVHTQHTNTEQRVFRYVNTTLADMMHGLGDSLTFVQSEGGRGHHQEP